MYEPQIQEPKCIITIKKLRVSAILRDEAYKGSLHLPCPFPQRVKFIPSVSFYQKDLTPI